jgi:hypothetical protein
MYARLVGSVLIALVLSGCSTARLGTLESTLRAYERNIRWSEFRTAFALAGNAQAPIPDFQRLQHIRVTSYERIDQQLLTDDDSKLTQTIEIRFVNVLNMSDRVIIDRQTWVYTELDERWRLTSPFPTFR